MKKGQFWGIGLLLLVFAIGFRIRHFTQQKSKVTIVRGYIGGEKIGFLENEKIKKILLKKYNIKIDYTKARSIEMVRNYSGKRISFGRPTRSRWNYLNKKSIN